MALWRIGLTGGIASGKSTVSRYLRTWGIPVIDADEIVRQSQMRGQEGWRQIFEVWGWRALDAHGALYRRKIAYAMFRDPRMRETMGTLLHPLVRKEITNQVQDLAASAAPLVVLDIPLLLESDWSRSVDEVWLVYATVEQQRQRLMARDRLTREDADRRILAQTSLFEKMTRSQRIINNTGSLEILEREVRHLWEHAGD